ncbi:calcitonin/calcitonin-related polypeptide, alpha isoform X2 [Chiloscyllium plagiosum]|uniref:calcitonin/calcitonin-related polypeptide, alpha isoform X2 n=1 Tax=Chiloscyllium plagiosum TaxID=36176 RepID=UPI001CB7E841|nr:calcitonin/calcitonin-related polypeptide, alpha isoform X2 [Chiloscyllium plagiosum]
MVLLKISAFFVVCAVFVCQINRSHAVPLRSVLESASDRVALNDYEVRRLLNALVKEFIQMMAEELEQEIPDANSSIPLEKRACKTATCATHRLADFLSRTGGMGNSDFVPTDVGANAFGRRRRNAQM